MTVKELFTTVGFDAIVKAPYSQVASAKLAICRKETFFGQSKFGFLRGLRLILY